MLLQCVLLSYYEKQFKIFQYQTVLLSFAMAREFVWYENENAPLGVFVCRRQVKE